MDDNRLAREPIGKLLLKLAIPTITAQIANMLYNIVNRIYIGNMPGVGKLAITGLGVAFPIITLISAFAMLVGMGGAPLASIEMGKRNNEKAEQIMGNCFTLLVGLSLVLTAVFLVLAKPLLLAFGASAETLPYAQPYLQIYSLGTIFVLLTLGLNNFITAQGFTKTSMRTVLIGSVLNIILDPILIYGFHMGVYGAALGTIVSQAVSCIWVLYFLLGKKSILRLKPQFLKLKLFIVKSVLSLGLSPFVMGSTDSLVQLILNTLLYKFGGDPAVGAMTIVTSLIQMCMMLLHGLGYGAQPIISYNYGAGNYVRVKKTFRLFFITGMIIATVYSGALVLFPRMFAMIFNSDPQFLAGTSYAVRICFAGFFSMGAQVAVQQTFLALGQAKISIFIALLRKVILLIPLAFILPNIGLGITGVYMSEPIADFLCASAACIIFAAASKNLLSNKGKTAVIQ